MNNSLLIIGKIIFDKISIKLTNIFTVHGQK